MTLHDQIAFTSAKWQCSYKNILEGSERKIMFSASIIILIRGHIRMEITISLFPKTEGSNKQTNDSNLLFIYVLFLEKCRYQNSQRKTVGQRRITYELHIRVPLWW